MSPNYYLGLDFGTSGARAIAIDDRGEIQASIAVSLNAPEARCAWFGLWTAALEELLTCLDGEIRQHLRAIAIDGTSASVFFCDRHGQPCGEPLLYNDDRAQVVLERVAEIAPEHHPTRSATSSLAKLLWLLELGAIETALGETARVLRSPYTFCHQADWLACQLHGVLGVSDYNNALKLGYDPAIEAYPDWFCSGLRAVLPRYSFSYPSPLPPSPRQCRQVEGTPSRTAIILPQVVAPGTPIATITPAIARRFSLPPRCTVLAGTTDSMAAFLASGASQPGTAVTSLGSTLAIKLLSRSRLDDARYGIYSHRLGDLWLAGGASNTGGAVLRHFFSDRELANLSHHIPDIPSPFNYYPLLVPGERFPVNDPALPPQIQPRPDDPTEFLHGLLDGIARIEAQGYHLLCALGAEPLSHVLTTGGGAQNTAWQRLRSRRLGVPVAQSVQSEAAYGTATLARRFASSALDESR